MKNLFLGFLFCFFSQTLFAQQTNIYKHWQGLIDFAQYNLIAPKSVNAKPIYLNHKILVDLFYQQLKGPAFADIFDFNPCAKNLQSWCLSAQRRDAPIFRISLVVKDLTDGHVQVTQNELNLSFCNSLDNTQCFVHFKMLPGSIEVPKQNLKVIASYLLYLPMKFKINSEQNPEIYFNMAVKFSGERLFSSKNNLLSSDRCRGCTEQKESLSTSIEENDFDYTLNVGDSDTNVSDDFPHTGLFDCNDKKSKINCTALELVHDKN